MRPKPVEREWTRSRAPRTRGRRFGWRRENPEDAAPVPSFSGISVPCLFVTIIIHSILSQFTTEAE